jgi:hypothetical protein
MIFVLLFVPFHFKFENQVSPDRRRFLSNPLRHQIYQNLIYQIKSKFYNVSLKIKKYQMLYYDESQSARLPQINVFVNEQNFLNNLLCW